MEGQNNSQTPDRIPLLGSDRYRYNLLSTLCPVSPITEEQDNNQRPGLIPLPDPALYRYELLSTLLQSGLNGNFVLSCRGSDFKLHTSVWSVSSGLIESEVQSIQENEGKVIRADMFEVDTVRRMIQFVYLGFYDLHPKPFFQEDADGDVDSYEHAFEPSDSEVNSESGSAPGSDADSIEYQPEISSRDRSNPCSEPGGAESLSETTFPKRFHYESQIVPEAITDGMYKEIVTCHIKVHRTAEYFQIPSLALFCRFQIIKIMRSCWRDEAFPGLLKLAWATSHDQLLRLTFAELARERGLSLSKVEGFTSLDFMDEFKTVMLSLEEGKTNASDQEGSSQHDCDQDS